MWGDIAIDGSTPLSDTLLMAPPGWHKNSIRILISDLLWPDDPMLTLQPMADGAASVIVVQLLARVDSRPDMLGNVRLVDSETGEISELFADAAARDTYRRALERHQQNWYRACRQIGAELFTIDAETIVHDWRLIDMERRCVLGIA